MSSFSPGANPFLIITERLELLDAPYMVTGSVAAIVYGQPRLTNDVDVVLSLDIAHARKLDEIFPATDFYCPPTEVVLLEASRAQRGHFNVIHLNTGFKADIYLEGNDPLHRWALSQATYHESEGKKFKVAPIEYVIIRKLEFYREGGSEKHLRDIRNMVETWGDRLDHEKLGTLVRERALTAEWEQAKSVSL
jgi:hypothetical protein